MKSEKRDVEMEQSCEVNEVKEEYLEKIKSVLLHRVDGLVVAFSKNSLFPFYRRFFSDYQVDILIEGNASNKAYTSFVINSASLNQEAISQFRKKIISLFPIFYSEEFIMVIPLEICQVLKQLIKVFNKEVELCNGK